MSDAGGPVGRTIPFCVAVVQRGAGYGHLAGLVSGVLVGGALVGGLLAWRDPSWLVGCMVLGGFVGGLAGLGAGIIGGMAFALAGPCLTRHAAAPRLTAAAVAPGVLLLAWGAVAIGSAGAAQAIFADNETTVAVLSAIGAVAGALVGSRVLYGKRRTPPGGDRADPLQ